jgi:hypothetical protein
VDLGRFAAMLISVKTGLSAILIGAAALAMAALDPSAAGQRWWAHIEYLASDAMRGRQTGSKEYLKAAEYVADQFRQIGLEAAGTNHQWFQTVHFRVRQLNDEKSSLALESDGKAQPAAMGADVILLPALDSPAEVTAPAVFVGYGLNVPEAGYDDLSQIDVKGKIAVFLASAPASITGPVRAHYQASAQRWKALREAGAVGVISIPLPTSMDVPWERMALSRFGPRMFFADPAMNEMRGEQMAAVWNPATADKLFAGTPHNMAELLPLASAGKKLPVFPLAVGVHARLSIEDSEAESPNVVGKLPGADPQLSSEYVIMSAHLDHIGVGAPINGDAIYNGAMDNAAGVASLIEVAREVAQNRSRLRRSVIFLAVCGEEKGELGSQWFAAHPTVPLENIVADVNVDMFLPIFPLHWLEVQGLNESTLGEAVRAAARADGIQVQADKQPQRNLFIRSDQYSFVRHGIPALAFKFGYLPGGPEEAAMKEWLHTRYHAPSDDLQQPVDKDSAARFNAVIARLIESISRDPARPQWYPASFFRRFAAQRATALVR